MKRFAKRLGWLVGLLFLGLNIVAFFHAYRMSHFTAEGDRTPSSADLNRLQKVGVLLGGVKIPKPKLWGDPSQYGLRYSDVKIKTADGFSLSAWLISGGEQGVVDGQGLVLMFHGYTATRSQLMAEAAYFVERGFEVLAVDHRGCGESEGAYTSVGFHEAKDVAAARAWAQQYRPDEPIFAYGISMGGVAVLRAIAEGGCAFDGVIIECPFDRFVHTVQARFKIMKLPSFPMASVLSFWGGVQLNANVFAHNPAVYAESVHCPLLVLSGAHDRHAPSGEGRAVAGGAPQGQFVLFE